MFDKSQIGFAGGGNMGEALIKGLIAASLLRPNQIHVFDVLDERMEYLRATYAVQPCSELGDLARRCDTIVLAVKPQSMSAVLTELAPSLTARSLVISIAAGVSIHTIATPLPAGLPIIRVMPNTPALVLQGASALARGEHATDEHMDQALALFRAVGTAIEVDEKLMDTVTGLSGSGPGYILLLLESLIDGGVLMGLPRPIARELVLQTALGTIKLAQETGRHPAELKDMITSPGGTTIRGLAVIEERGVRGALMEAVEAATLRSRELGKLSG
jgi:pyrroline-5-carboxylate reductase